MNISSVILTTLLIIALLTSWVLIIEDFETNYVETNISDVSEINDTYKSTFGNASEINQSMQPLVDSLRDLDEENKGFFEGLLDYGMVIPIAIISFVGVTFEILGSIVTNLTTYLMLIGIPMEIVGIAVIGLLAFFLFKLIGFWRRTPV
jgi:hypothetical protein